MDYHPSTIWLTNPMAHLSISFQMFFSSWGWVKTLVPSEPQVIAGIYGCSSH